MTQRVECVFGPGRDVAQQTAALARDGEIEDVIEACADEDDARDAMNDAAQVFAHAQRVRKPRIREFEREAGNDQNDEATEQNQMLPALIHGHALHEGILHAPARDGLAAPDDGVVQEHGADDERG